MESKTVTPLLSFQKTQPKNPWYSTVLYHRKDKEDCPTMGAAASAALTDPVASTFEAIRTTLNDGAAFADMPREELISHALGLRDQLRAALAHYDSAKEYSAKEASCGGVCSCAIRVGQVSRLCLCLPLSLSLSL